MTRLRATRRPRCRRSRSPAALGTRRRKRRTRRDDVVIELTERLQATRAELAALAEPHDAASRLGRRLSAAGWPTLLDALSAPEESWPAIEAVVGGELESALLWADDDPTGEIGDARGAARLLAPDAGGQDDGRAQALAAVAGERTLADWVAMPAAPRVFARTVLAPDLDALLAGWRGLPPGWAAVTATGDLADARGVVIRGRGDPPGGAAARAHARRRELGQAVTRHRGPVRRGTGRRAHDGRSSPLVTGRAPRRPRGPRRAGARGAGRPRVPRCRRRRRRARKGAARRSRQRSRLPPSRRARRRIPQSTETSSRMRCRLARQPPTRLARGAIALAVRRDEARDAWTQTRRAAEEVETRTAGMRSGRAANEARVAQLRASIPERRTGIAAIAAERAAIAGQHEAATRRPRIRRGRTPPG